MLRQKLASREIVLDRSDVLEIRFMSNNNHAVIGKKLIINKVEEQEGLTERKKERKNG